MKFRFKYADRIVGLFLLGALAFVGFMVVGIGFNKRLFKKNIQYTSIFSSAEGLKKGLAITFKGFEVGKVKDIKLNERGEIEMDLVIFEEYNQWVRPRSVLYLVSNPIGIGGGLQLYPGITPGVRRGVNPFFIPSSQSEEGKRAVREGYVLTPEGGEDIAGILNSVADLLKNVNSTVISLNQAIDGTTDSGNLYGILLEAKNTLANLEAITSSPVGLIPTLLYAEGSSVTKFFNDGEELYQNINQTLLNLSSITNNVDGMTPELNLLLKDVSEALENAQKVMEGLINNPLIKDGISDADAEPGQTGVTTGRDEGF